MNNMNCFDEVLKSHYLEYPKMQIRDIVKLIYQNEFAGGHFIIDEEQSLIRLKEELSSVSQDRISHKLSEDIGNGLCRLNLAYLNNTEIKIETVNKFFINTANSNKGSYESFEEKLEIFKQLCKENLLDFPLQQVEDYLYEYKAKGYPAVSHSEVYRQCYHPAYRIVKKEYLLFFEIFNKIDSLLKKKDAVTLAIDGKSGSGKSTLANLLFSVYSQNANFFHMDDFFLTPEQKTNERLNKPGGNVNYERFENEIIKGIKSGDNFQYRPYDCKTNSLKEPVFVAPKILNIIEGVYSMHPVLADIYDLKVFLNISEQQQSTRILKRNGEFMHKRFISEWIPLENRYFDEFKISEKCDLIFEIS